MRGWRGGTPLVSEPPISGRGGSAAAGPARLGPAGSLGPGDFGRGCAWRQVLVFGPGMRWNRLQFFVSLVTVTGVRPAIVILAPAFPAVDAFGAYCC